MHDDLDTLVMDDEMLSKIAELNDPKKAREIEIKIVARLRRHLNNPVFVALGRQLEDLKDRHHRGLLTSLEFLKHLLELARRVVEAERKVDPQEEQSNAKAALTELFNEVKNDSTPVMVERIVNDIDSIVRAVRYPGWQQTTGGEREV